MLEPCVIEQLLMVRQAHHERVFLVTTSNVPRSLWVERTPPTTLLESGVRVLGIDYWIGRLTNPENAEYANMATP